MAITFKKFIKGILLKGESSDAADNIEGSIFVNSSDLRIKAYIQGAVREVLTNSQSQVLTNKTINADNNPVSNLETDNLKAGVLNTSATLASASNDQIPSALAVKTYSDSGVSTHSALTTGVHGVTGSVVGTSDSQTLTNKTITGADIRTPSRSDVKQGTKANLTTYALTASNGQLCFATDSKEMFQVVDGLLKAVGAGGAADVDALLIQEFDNASLTDFTQTGLSLIETNPLRGTKTARLIHDTPITGVVRSFKQTLSVSPKFRGVNMTAALTLRSTASQGNVTIQFRDETNSVDYPSQQLQTNSQAVASLTTSSSSPTVSGFSNSIINSLRVGMSVTGSGVPSGTTIASINTTSLTIDLSQNATASATVTLRFSDLPRTIQLGFQIPANCSSYSYTISALQEDGSPETYVDDIVLKNYWLGMSNQGQSTATLEVPAATEWVSFTPASLALGGFGTVTNWNARWRRVGDSMQVAGTFTMGTVTTAVGTFPLPIGYNPNTSKLSTNNSPIGQMENQGAFGLARAIFYSVSNAQIQAGIGELAGGTGTLDNRNVNTYFSTGTQIGFNFTIPISGWGATESKSFTTTDLVPAKAVLGNTALDIPKVTGWQGYTPTFQGFGSPTNIEFEWRQVGENVEIRGKFATGVTTAVEARVSLPAGLTSAGTTLIPSLQALGTYAYGVSSTNTHGGFILSEPSVTYITFSANGIFGSGANNPLTKINGSSLTVVAAGELISLTASIPCAGLSATEEVVVSGTQSALVQEVDSSLFLTSPNGRGSVNTGVLRFATLQQNIGSAVQYTDSATDGASFVIKESGIYTISFDAQNTTSTDTAIVAITKNSTQLNVNPQSVSAANRLSLGFSRLSANSANEKGASASWSGYLTQGDVIRAQVEGITISGATFSIARQGSLKQLNVSSDQKITIPTSELRMEGASTRGTGSDSAIVRFDNIAKLRGDAFTVVSDATVGTAITMKKAGRLHISTSLYGTANQLGTITINQQTRTSYSVVAGEVIASLGLSNTTGLSTATGFVDVKVGDIIRVGLSAAPIANGANNLNLSFQEQDIAVSVTNTLPQFSESDSSVRVDTANGYGSTPSNKIRRFSNVRDNIGTDIEYVDSSTDGASFKVRSSGVYHISYSDTAVTTSSLIGLTKNSIELTTSIAALIDTSSRLALAQLGSGADENKLSISWTGYLNSGDIVRPHNSGSAAQDNSAAHFTISKIGKPNVTGVDVTPFVNVQMSDTEVIESNGYSVTFGSTNTAVPVFSISRNSNKGIISVDSSAANGTSFRALKRCSIVITASGNSSAGTLSGYITKNSSTLTTGSTPATSQILARQDFPTTAEIITAATVLEVGDVIRVQRETTGISAFGYLSLTAEALSDSIITPSESFSTDTASLQYVAGTTDVATTLANLATRPVGSYTTFTYATSTNTRSITSTRPTQTDADMNVNGILLYTRAYNAPSTAAQPAAIAIQIGKGLKGRSLDLYKSAGKVTAGSLDSSIYSTTVQYGAAIKDYNEITGVLLIDAGFNLDTSIVARNLTFSDATNATSGYLVINASKSPALVGVPQVQPRVAVMRDERTSGTNGGSTSTSYTARIINTLEDQFGIVQGTFAGTAGTNTQFTLQAGTYHINCVSHFFTQNQSCKTRLQNITAGTTALVGSTSNTASGGAISGEGHSVINGVFTVSSASIFEIQDRTNIAVATSGRGTAATFGDNEVYLECQITKIK